MIRVTYEVIRKDSSFKISFDGTTIRLEGQLKGDPLFGEYDQAIQSSLGQLDNLKPRRLLVDSSQCTASPLGIKNWTDAVSDHIVGGHHLRYLASPFSEAVKKSGYYQKHEKDHIFD